MLSTDVLSKVKRIVVHEQRPGCPCPDGRASALILRDALPQAHIVEMSYNSPEHINLVPAPGYLFCDFSPWAPKEGPGRAEAFAKWANMGTIVLDHHGQDIVAPFGDLGIFGENESLESGAMLAYQRVLAPMRLHSYDEHAHELAFYSAIRDTWYRSSPDWQRACELAASLCFLPLRQLLRMSIPTFLTMAKQIGPTLVDGKMTAVRDAAKNAVLYTLDGVRFATIPGCGLTSDVSDVMADATDMVVGFDYVHENDGRDVVLQLSLRSRGRVDVTSVAKSLGGGGHENGQAAGCRIAIIENGSLVRTGAPYDVIVNTLQVAQMWRHLIASKE